MRLSIALAAALPVQWCTANTLIIPPIASQGPASRYGRGRSRELRREKRYGLEHRRIAVVQSIAPAGADGALLPLMWALCPSWAVP